MKTNKEITRLEKAFELSISDVKFFNEFTILALSISGSLGVFLVNFKVL